MSKILEELTEFLAYSSRGDFELLPPTTQDNVRHNNVAASPNYSWRPSDLSEASGVGRVDGGFSRRVFRATGG